jgi:hypothetical protein
MGEAGAPVWPGALMAVAVARHVVGGAAWVLVITPGGCPEMGLGSFGDLAFGP